MENIDPSKLKVQFMRHEIVGKYAIFDVRVKFEEETWLLKARYSQILNVHNLLRRTLGNTLPIFPPKKMRLFGGLKPDFLSKRLKELEHYVTAILDYPDKYPAEEILPLIEYLTEDGSKISGLIEKGVVVQGKVDGEVQDANKPDPYDEIYKEYFLNKLLQVPNSSNFLIAEEDSNQKTDRVLLSSTDCIQALQVDILSKANGGVGIYNHGSSLEAIANEVIPKINQLIQNKRKTLARDREFIQDIKQYNQVVH